MPRIRLRFTDHRHRALRRRFDRIERLEARNAPTPINLATAGLEIIAGMYANGGG